jgi:hypothetical protein
MSAKGFTLKHPMKLHCMVKLLLLLAVLATFAVAGDGAAQAIA